MKVVSRSVEETRALGEELGREVLRPGDVVVLTGELGTGKTALAQGVGRGLEVDGPVVSPTFTLVREYEGRVRLCHVDVFRLERVQELHELGIEEQLDDSVTLIEWGEVAASALPQDRLEVRLTAGAGPDERIIELVLLGESWRRRSRRLAEIVEGHVSDEDHQAPGAR
ncbi:MAG TPA: tRNA (adenosine(37)-N6)-threonylcarbamoyltransferase complex ATPase subunit type 1 TsaE [Acidimicrobiia bacterium]|nr:tRNA (adenosine(37)-N6)-threonylcarbamoyltransferase complex ATPase subunit type 1 TsaE [Acidimicrobiia bacterium]HTC80454.1 tRNA (adenosine(37)-N6)-threonylcarbamoyltransferase complex ATPase subunit type 1 TsaE [Acidimicrobiia bacterium]